MNRRFALVFISLIFSMSLLLPAQSRPQKKSAPAPVPIVAAAVKVWVNTKTGVYHYPGKRWYGRTASGEYMSLDAAKAKGYRPARNGQ